MPLNFTYLDGERDQLQEKHPGWRVRYVPFAGGITWCAQRLPTLNEDSPEHLSEAIDEVVADQSTGSGRSLEAGFPQPEVRSQLAWKEPG